MAAPWTGGAKLRIIGKIHGQDCINVLHFATNTVINDPQAVAQLLTALATAMLACAFDNLRAAVTSDWTLTRVEAAQIHPVLGDVVEMAPENATQGQLSAASHSFAATYVRIGTGFGGRRKRGSFYLPPVGETETANSLIAAGSMDQVTAFLKCVAGKFIGAGATEDWRLGVLSRKTLKEGGTFDTAFTEAIRLTPSNVVAKMGSRKVGKGG
jgi:hypothetical protein